MDREPTLKPRARWQGRALSLLLAGPMALLLGAMALAQERGESQRQGPERGRPGPAHSMTTLPGAPVLDIVPGRPGEHSISLILLSHSEPLSARLQWSAVNDPRHSGSRLMKLQPGDPLHLSLDGLRPDTDYRYELRRGEAADGPPLALGRFHTQRPPGSSFTVTLTADSHLDQNTDALMYQRSLAAARADAPDFHIDLGDTFMVDKHASRDSATAQYLAQRHFFGQLGLPLFLVLGNHDGEERKLLREGADSLGVWANQQRKRFFANPEPGGIYSGNALADPWAGRLQDYYAWHWGDALFVVLNPYWHAPSGRTPERWNLSLGETQYRWLRQTLESSRARYKFVFVHQLLGGNDRQGRGGAEAVPYGEWGGLNADGSVGFASRRPGWQEPIHELLRRSGVSAVFHGHDHLFAWQERDGIAYVEVPQPGHRGSGHGQAAADYGYRSGLVRGEGGYLRMHITPQSSQVEFLGTEGAAPRLLHRATLLPQAQP